MSVILERPETTEAPVVDVPTVSKEEARRREVLLRAAEIMEKGGYLAGRLGGLHKADGPHCILGALGVATGATRGSQAYGAALRWLGVSKATAYRWNDELSLSCPKEEAAEIVARRLRRMANGASWEEATR